MVNAKVLVTVRGEAGPVLPAASHVEHDDLPSFDASYLVHSDTSPIVSSDDSDDAFPEHSCWTHPMGYEIGAASMEDGTLSPVRYEL